jgi:hypothetical protein
MKPVEISRQLPNGFHGARIERITTDYAHRNADFDLAVLVPDSSTEKSRLRGCRLRITGLAFLSLDVPDPYYDYTAESPIETGSLLDTTLEILPSLTALQQDLGNGYFFNTFFVEEWNRFIHFAGTGAEFSWTAE